MDRTHDEDLPVIYADIEKLQRELEQLCVSVKARPAERDQSDSTQPDTIKFRGK